MEVSTVNVNSTSKSNNSTQNNSNNSNININSNNNNNNNNNTSLNHNNEDNLQSNHLMINSKMSVNNSINNFSNNISNNGSNNQAHINSSTATKNKLISYVQHFPNIHSIEKIPEEDLKLNEIELDVSVIINRILNKVEEENLLKVTADYDNANLPQDLLLQNVNKATSMQEQSSYRDNDSGLDSTQLDRNSLDLSPDDGSCDLVIDSNLPSDDMQESINQTDQQQHQQQPNEKFPVENQESKDTDKIAPDTVNTITTIESIAAPNTKPDAFKQDSGFKDIAEVEKLNIPQLQNDNEPKLISITDRHPEEQKQINSEADSEAIKKHPPLEEAKLKDSLEEVAKLDGIVSEITKVDDLTDVQGDKAKDMVTLKNLEISPPPPAEVTEKTNEQKVEEEMKLGKPSTKRQTNKRKRNDNSESVSERCESTESGGRSKRQRTQTKLFQAGDAKSYEEPKSLTSSTRTKSSTRPAARNRKKSTTSSNTDANPLTAQDDLIQDTTTDLQDVIFYEKNDYLAIRNEEDSFFLCQLAETVRVGRPLLKVKWLDTKNGGQTYFLTSQYDKVPRKSIIVPVSLNKLKSEKKGEQTFTLSDHDRINIEDRLKRSLNAQSECGSSQEMSTDN